MKRRGSARTRLMMLRRRAYIRMGGHGNGARELVMPLSRQRADRSNGVKIGALSSGVAPVT